MRSPSLCSGRRRRPASGVTLLETYAQAGIHADLPRVFQEWQVWAAEVLDTHLAYPVLAYFRSSHTKDSWISSLGAVMDAATLVITTIDGGPTAWAKMFRAVGGHCVEDLVQFFNLTDDTEVGVEARNSKPPASSSSTRYPVSTPTHPGPTSVSSA